MSRLSQSIALTLIASILTGCSPTRAPDRSVASTQFIQEMAPEEFAADLDQETFDAEYELFNEATGESYETENQTGKPDYYNILRSALRPRGKKEPLPKPVIQYGVILGGTEGYSENPKKQIRPASTAKMFTTALALKMLPGGGDFTFKTRLLWRKKEATGEVAYLRVTGSGDPTLGDSISGSASLATRIAGAIAEAGVKKVYGKILIDSSDARWEKRVTPTGWLTTGKDPDKPERYILGSLGRLTPGSLQTALKAKLKAAGIEWVLDVPAPFKESEAQSKVAIFESAPLRKIVQTFMKWSLNHIGETLLRKVGEVQGSKSAPDLLAAGLPLLREFVSRHVGGNPITLHDGCGLSRDNRVNAEGMTTFLEEMTHEPFFADFYASFGVPGGTGWLRSRMVGTPAQKMIHAKTGTLNRPVGTYQIAGYLEEKGKNGQKTYHPFAILTEAKTSDNASAYCHHAQDLTLSAWAKAVLN